MHQDEWKIIYETYSRSLYLYALSLTENRQDAEDLLQETYVKAYLSYRETGSIKYWLVTVLRNEFYNLQRKRKWEIPGEEELSDFRASEKNILEQIIQKEERRHLFLEIQKLRVSMKEVLIESIYFQMKDEEIGKLHGFTNENVRKIRSRAKQKLLKNMKEGK